MAFRKVGMLRHILGSCNWKCNANTHLLYYSSSSIDIKPSFSKYLVESLGFTEQQSISTSSKLAKQRSNGEKRVGEFKFEENVISVVGFFKNNGFSDTQIRNVVSGYPHVLTTDVEKTLIPKFRALQDHGFSSSDIADIVSVNARLLRNRVDSATLSTISSVGQVLGLSGDGVVSLLKRFRWYVMRTGVMNLEMNVALLRSYGVLLDVIRKHIVASPLLYAVLPETFEKAVTKVEHKLGIPRHSKMFLNGIQVLICSTDKTIDSKVETFKSFGWTESDVMELFRRSPYCLAISVLLMKKKLDFLMKELGYTPAYLKSLPALFSCSLEKRIMPRHTILQALRRKGLIREDCSLYYSVCLSEISFMKKFVVPFKEVHGLYSELNGYPLRLLTEDKL